MSSNALQRLGSLSTMVQARTKRVQEMNRDALQQHVTSTYHQLRMGLAVISFAFPLFLWLIGKLWYGIPLQNSMSAYYFAESPGEGPIRSWFSGIDIAPIKYFLFFLAGLDGEAPMRSWFVGTLFVLGIVLYLYKGFSHLENYLLNVGGLFAVGVALFPMEWNCSESCRRFTFHGIWALGAFLCIATVAIFCSAQTLKLPLDEQKKQNYKKLYKWTGTCMAIFPVVAFIITWLTNDRARFIFIAEWLGIWSFAIYWWIKSREIKENRAETHAIEKDPALSSAD